MLTKKRFFFIKSNTAPDIRCVCHNCGFGITQGDGSLPGFLKLYYPDVYQEYIFDNFKKQPKDKKVSLLDKLKTKFDPTKVVFQESFDLSPCIPIADLPPDHFVSNYVKGRMLPPERVMYCSNVNDLVAENKQIGKPVPSLIIPYYLHDKRCEVFQIRFFDPNRMPKYLTFKLKEESIKVFNLDFVDPTIPVFVLEGPIDSMYVENAIAMGGSDMAVVPVPDPVFVYDNEPRANIINRKMRKTIDKGHKIVMLPERYDNDINDMVIAGETGITELLKKYTFQGLKAKAKYSTWRKCK